jgi:hypothetical protein
MEIMAHNRHSAPVRPSDFEIVHATDVLIAKTVGELIHMGVGAV